MADQTGHPDPTATPIVGRDREQATLREALVAALAGRGSPALIGGEAGIGKTTLAEALCREATDRGALVLIGRCYDLSETPPYGPWAEAFAQAPRGDAVPPAIAGGTATSQASLFATVRAWLGTLAARRPLVLLLEDLHWADPASLDLLRAIGRQLADLPLFILATYRDDEIGPDHPLYALIPFLVREARAHRLDLRPLDEAAIHTLVERHYRLAPDDEARLVPYLVARAEGNPFFLSELLRALEESGTLRSTGRGWTLGPLEQLPVPRLLRQVIDGRLDRLEVTTREALGLAAVIGQVVPFDLWAVVGERDEATLLDVTLEAGSARLMEELRDGMGVRFVHALTREAVYEGLRPSHRRTLHRRVGEALLASPNPDPDAVASHLVRAGDPRAADWLRRAGDRAHSAYAWLIAAARYEAALVVAEQNGITPLEQAWLLFRLAQLRRFADASGALPRMEEAASLAEQGGNRFLAAQARLCAGHLRCLAGDYRRGIPEMEAGLEAVETLPELERAWQVHLDATDRSVGRGTYIGYLAILGHYDKTCSLGEPYVSTAPDPDTTRLLGAAPHADGQLGLGIAYAALGKPDAARHMYTQARAALSAVDHPLMVGLVTGFELSWLTLPYRSERLDERRALASEGLSVGLLSLIGWSDNLPSLWRLPLLVAEGRWREVVATAAGQGPNSLVTIWQTTMLAWVAAEQGETNLAWQFVRRWLPDGPATEPGWIEFLEALHLQRLAAALAVDAGDLPEARAWLEAHDRWLAWNVTVLGRAEGQLGWAAYHRATENTNKARECAKRALAYAVEPRQPLAILAAHRLLGELCTANADYADARAYLDAALTLAETCAVPYERALTLLALAELCFAAGEREVATTALNETRALLEPLNARPALARAAALDARLAVPPAAVPVALPFGLSAREAEVLRLLAEGLTDRQIAARLFVSRNTVASHVKAVYGKLGVTSRVAATRLASEYGLT